MSEHDFSDEKNFWIGFLIVATVIILFGFGGFYIMTEVSDSWQQKCQKTCHAEDKDFIVAPVGTTGRSIEGGREPTEPAYQCVCVKRKSK